MGHIVGAGNFENPKKGRFLLSPIIGGADDVINPSVLVNFSSMVEDEDNNYHDNNFDAGHSLS